MLLLSKSIYAEGNTERRKRKKKFYSALSGSRTLKGSPMGLTRYHQATLAWTHGKGEKKCKIDIQKRDKGITQIQSWLQESFDF